MSICACQRRPRLGDVNHNLEIALTEIKKCNQEIIVFSELFLIGYPPTDHLLLKDKTSQIDDALNQLLKVSTETSCLIVMGSPFFDGTHWRNAALAMANGEIVHKHFKNCLPNYDIFNDSRYFVPGENTTSFFWNNHHLAMLICEDIWVNKNHHRYSHDPVLLLKNKPLDLVIHLTASPFEKDKFNQRLAQVKRVAFTLKSAVLSVNQVGGYNDILFDGQSMYVNNNAEITDVLPEFTEVVIKVNQTKPISYSAKNPLENLSNAIEFGLKQYLKYTGFETVIVGLSGGIDSALVAAFAVKALGPKNVKLFTLPTQFNSNETKSDAHEMANRMGCDIVEHSIESYRNQLLNDLPESLSLDQLNGLTDQNIQSRLRGVILMAISNQTNALLLTTGNKSELAMGYATLYGDMAGGLNIIGDLFKSDVYALAKWLNKTYQWIPDGIINRPPSAELAPNQKDDDVLPAYNRLDKILDEYMIQKLPLNTLYEMNDNKDVDFVLKRLGNMEFKRFQSPPILKLSTKSFGRGWQYPLVQ